MTGVRATTTAFDVQQAIQDAFRVIAPPTRFGTITLDAPFGEAARCLTVGVSGAVTVVDLQGNASTIPYVEAGKWFPIVFTQVNTSGTTASGGIMWGS